MTPTSVTITRADGTAVAVPLGQSPSGTYQASAEIDGTEFTIYCDIVRTTPARTPSHARWTEH